MVKNLENTQKLFKIFEQAIMGIKILLILMVAITSLLWLLKLINIPTLDFINPILNIIEKAMQFQFGHELKKGQQGLDGALFVFIMLLLTTIYILSQVRKFVEFKVKDLEIKIVDAKKREEEMFNMQLEVDAQNELKKYNNIILLVKLKIENISKNDYLNYGNNNIQPKPELNEQFLSKFYKLFKDMPGCKFQKDGDVLIITADNFKMIESIIMKLSEVLQTLRKDLFAQKLSLTANMAIDTYKDDMPVNKVYHDIKNVLKLQLPNELLCFGNFKNRYQLVNNPKFKIYLKGSYRIINEENVYVIIKKD